MAEEVAVSAAEVVPVAACSAGAEAAVGVAEGRAAVAAGGDTPAAKLGRARAMAACAGSALEAVAAPVEAVWVAERLVSEGEDGAGLGVVVLVEAGVAA